MTDLRIELKVCEGCGVLWLRAVSGGRYCQGCAKWMSDGPVMRVGQPSPSLGRTRRRRARTLRVLAAVGGGR
jgi:hypothetical protein